MKRILFRITIPLMLVGVLISLAFYAGTKTESGQNTIPVAVKEAVRTIAVVNMDQGIQIKDQAVNYGTQLISFTKDLFTSTSLEDARTGVEKGRYGAYIIVPSTFSKSVWSINGSPEKAVLDYAVNPNLREDVLADVIYDLKAFEMKLDTDISYLYLHAILEEFHNGQDSATTVMKHDKQDTERLEAIIPEDLLQPLSFVELNPAPDYPEDIELGDAYAVITEAADGMGERFDTYIQWAEEDLEALKEDKEPFVDSMENMRIAIADITLLEDEQGDRVYAEGKSELGDGLEQFEDTLKTERAYIKDAFQWVGRRDILASGSNATPDKNTWLDEVDKEQKRQKDAYEKELEGWLVQFDYTKLATASNATPPNADPPEATPPNATPPNVTPPNATSSNADGWMVERDMKVVTESVAAIYAKIMTDLEGLCLNEEDLEAIEEVLKKNLQEDEAIHDIVASASNAHPIEIRPSPEAEAYVKEFFKELPVQEGGMKKTLDEIEKRMERFSEEQIKYIESTNAVPMIWFDRTFEEKIIRQIERQGDQAQEFIRKELDELDQAFRIYEDRLDGYDPLSKTDEGELNTLHKTIGEGVRLMENLINGKSEKDRTMMSQLEEISQENIKKLQFSIDESFTGTSQNVLQVLEDAKKNRAQVNGENESLLSDFTKKLSYTRNGSVANTNTYSFLVNPVESKEKKLTGRFDPIRIQGFESNGMVGSAVALALGLLLLQGGIWIKRRSGKKKGR